MTAFIHQVQQKHNENLATSPSLSFVMLLRVMFLTTNAITQRLQMRALQTFLEQNPGAEHASHCSKPVMALASGISTLLDIATLCFLTGGLAWTARAAFCSAMLTAILSGAQWKFMEDTSPAAARRLR